MIAVAPPLGLLPLPLIVVLFIGIGAASPFSCVMPFICPSVCDVQVRVCVSTCVSKRVCVQVRLKLKRMISATRITKSTLSLIQKGTGGDGKPEECTARAVLGSRHYQHLWHRSRGR